MYVIPFVVLIRSRGSKFRIERGWPQGSGRRIACVELVVEPWQRQHAGQTVRRLPERPGGVRAGASHNQGDRRGQVRERLQARPCAPVKQRCRALRRCNPSRSGQHATITCGGGGVDVGQPLDHGPNVATTSTSLCCAILADCEHCLFPTARLFKPEGEASEVS